MKLEMINITANDQYILIYIQRVLQTIDCSSKIYPQDTLKIIKTPASLGFLNLSKLALDFMMSNGLPMDAKLSVLHGGTKVYIKPIPFGWISIKRIARKDYWS